jgi:DNA-binding NarL/FixJ family response regulator
MGATNRQISERLFMSNAAVKRETDAIFTKLGVSNRIQAVAEAYKRNIL